MASLTIDGIDYKIVERLGFQHGAGVYAALIVGPDGKERIAQRHSGSKLWAFRTPQERIAPLIEWAKASPWAGERENEPQIRN